MVLVGRGLLTRRVEGDRNMFGWARVHANQALGLLKKSPVSHTYLEFWEAVRGDLRASYHWMVVLATTIMILLLQPAFLLFESQALMSPQTSSLTTQI